MSGPDTKPSPVIPAQAGIQAGAEHRDGPLRATGTSLLDSRLRGNDEHSEVLLAEPRGFCAGVDRAIDIVEAALAKFGAPVYVRHEIVHNTFVVNDLKQKGAVFIEELADVPPGATLVFSAHGVSKAVQREAHARGFEVFDATCPLVTKVHVEVAKLAREGYEFLMIGHKGHPEVEGSLRRPSASRW